ncbi:MAG: response regulator [Lachnospiraceae bacterium]|nr:response regulator [Lachnospiraceae bacterium]
MKTILVDKEPLMQRMLEEVMKGIREVDVVGSFRNSEKALEYAEENTVEFALLDTEMPVMDGLDLGRKLQKVCPGIVLIYITENSDRLADIFKMKADYCIMKPCSRDDIEDAAERARLLSKRQKKQVTVQMFGRFDVFLNGKVLYFKNAKSKELLALCMDRCGGSVSMEEVIDKLWPERIYDEKVKRLYRKAVMNLQGTLREKGITEFFQTKRGSCYISKEEVECDYYTYLVEPEKNEKMFQGEYLFDYSWGEETLANLMNAY